MRIPKEIKILGHTYAVLYRNREREDGNLNPGTCDSKFCKIWIDAGWKKSQQEATLIHEIIEALNYNLKLNLVEEQIRGLESGLYQTLKDNNLLK